MYTRYDPGIGARSLGRSARTTRPKTNLPSSNCITKTSPSAGFLRLGLNTRRLVPSGKGSDGEHVAVRILEPAFSPSVGEGLRRDVDCEPSGASPGFHLVRGQAEDADLGARSTLACRSQACRLRRTVVEGVVGMQNDPYAWAPFECCEVGIAVKGFKLQHLGVEGKALGDVSDQEIDGQACEVRGVLGRRHPGVARALTRHLIVQRVFNESQPILTIVAVISGVMFIAMAERQLGAKAEFKRTEIQARYSLESCSLLR